MKEIHIAPIVALECESKPNSVYVKVNINLKRLFFIKTKENTDAVKKNVPARLLLVKKPATINPPGRYSFYPEDPRAHPPMAVPLRWPP